MTLAFSRQRGQSAHMVRCSSLRGRSYAADVTARTIELQMPTAEAWTRLRSAASTVGKIQEEHESSRYLVMKARYGLNAVHLRVSVISGATEGVALLEIDGRGHDVWGVASRKVIDRVCAEL